ncbi:restriction endonuclease [Corynebacterium sp. 70RC1]|nr:restriction endonuclease [Corynebacterium sp. 142RC1]MCQ9359269.1 restriction endonuclease [Corynebacterium sp. 142RC1]MCQ9365410.1 restriction endonuclease [Corynebacterium sp. 70RC1]
MSSAPWRTQKSLKLPMLWPSWKGDRGVDVVALDPSEVRTVVQCKRYLNKVSADPIQRLHSFAITRNAGRKIVITTADFTKDAIDEAKRTGTDLIDGQDLQELVGKFLPDFLSSSA